MAYWAVFNRYVPGNCRHRGGSPEAAAVAHVKRCVDRRGTIRPVGRVTEETAGFQGYINWAGGEGADIGDEFYVMRDQ